MYKYVQKLAILLHSDVTDQERNIVNCYIDVALLSLPPTVRWCEEAYKLYLTIIVGFECVRICVNGFRKLEEQHMKPSLIKSNFVQRRSSSKFDSNL